MAATFTISPKARVTTQVLGREKTPLIVIDEVLSSPISAVADASSEEFKYQANDFYPGQRAVIDPSYSKAILLQYESLFKTTFGFANSCKAETILSAYSMADTPAQQLKPIQMLPHFDSPDDHQLAMVHYLCEPKHGGTGFFRHRSTGTERVTKANLKTYGQCLKQEALSSKLHLDPKYVNQEHSLFESIGSVDVVFNRLIVYPSNLLHSGLIKTEHDLGTDPNTNRLTISSFIKLS